MTGPRKKPIRIIDHDPLPQSTQKRSSARHAKTDMLPGDAPVFGKRYRERKAEEIISADRPYASNGISEYFLSRVNERRNDEADRNQAGQQRRSAIRQPVSDPDGAAYVDVETSRIPVGILATVAILAFAVPVGFVFFTERMTGPEIDPMTTASIDAADGISVQDVSMTRMLKNGTFVVTINGKVSNYGTSGKSLRPLIITLRDENGREVQSWRHRLGKSQLDNDATLHFRTSAIDYSGAAKSAHVVARTVN